MTDDERIDVLFRIQTRYGMTGDVAIRAVRALIAAAEKRGREEATETLLRRGAVHTEAE